jgi:hypothetical protein
MGLGEQYQMSKEEKLKELRGHLAKHSGVNLDALPVKLEEMPEHALDFAIHTYKTLLDATTLTPVKGALSRGFSTKPGDKT